MQLAWIKGRIILAGEIWTFLLPVLLTLSLLLPMIETAFSFQENGLWLKSGVQLCPPACPSQNVVANVCLILVLILPKANPKISQGCRSLGKGRWTIFGLARDRGCYRDPCCGFSTQENGRDKIHSIQTEVLNLDSSCPSLALSESQNSFRIMEYSELEIWQWGADWKGNKTSSQTLLRNLPFLKSSYCKVLATLLRPGRKWIFLEVSPSETFVTLRPVKHSWAPLGSEGTADLCWGGFWMLELAFLCCCSLSCSRRLVRCFRQFCSSFTWAEIRAWLWFCQCCLNWSRKDMKYSVTTKLC